jgi:membrane-associated protease RseP (regulator of RpoE activity)
MPSSPPETVPAAPVAAQASSSRWRLHAQLFLATVASVFLMGLDAGEEWWSRSLSAASIHHGLLFTASLLGILVLHESGHYIAARIHKVETSLPYFIPMPYVSPFGTMGAVIRMTGSIRTRRALFDIGAAGPLAGLAAAIPLYLWGTAHPEFREASSTEGFMTLGDSLLTRILDHFAAPPAPPGMVVVSSSVAFGAWVGLFVTMINLLPVAQLDGGHVAYALFGRRQDRFAIVIHRAMLAFFFVSVTSFLVRDVRSGLGFHHLGDAVGNAIFWLVWFEVIAILGALSSRGQRGGREGAEGEKEGALGLPVRTRAAATVALALLAGFGRDHSSPLLWIAWFSGLGLLVAMEVRSGVLRPHHLVEHPPTGTAPLDPVRAAIAVFTLLFFVLLFMPTPIAL